jgi:hypothetical protein
MHDIVDALRPPLICHKSSNNMTKIFAVYSQQTPQGEVIPLFDFKVKVVLMTVVAQSLVGEFNAPVSESVSE